MLVKNGLNDNSSWVIAREPQRLPHGWYTLDIECNGVLPIGVYMLLVGNRVGVGLTRCTIRPLLPSYAQLREQVNNVCMVVNPLWRGPGNIHGFVLGGKFDPLG